MKGKESLSIDFVVVGCGIAGLRAAIELAQAGTVLVLAKGGLTETATELAQGGIAAALSDEDEISLHEQDTVAAGDGLCNVEAVRVLVQEGPKYIQELIAWGTQFDRAGTKLAFTREGAHSRSRILHAQGDSTGREISRALFARVNSLPNISLRAHAFSTALHVDAGRVSGLRFLDEKEKKFHDLSANAVLLATGGLGQVYSETTNPPSATGDGMAIAYEAGAILTDLEFVQFHPTALFLKGAPRFLLSEALRGEGGVLRNADLHRFMKHYHEAGELAPRDVVARAIVLEMHKSGAEFVYLDMTGKNPDFVRSRFPRIHATCLNYGLDIATDLIPVRPAAHYAMGGVKTDLWGRTSLPGLFAAGETACTGVHGANRLASNSLLEGLVYGARAGQAMAEAHSQNKRLAAAATARSRSSLETNSSSPKPGSHSHSTASKDAQEKAALDQIRRLLWHDVGIIRHGRGLEQAQAQLRALRTPLPQEPNRSAFELRNIWTLAQLIAQCALARRESRGSHYRSDYPCPDEDFRKHSVISLGKNVTFEN